MIEFINHIHKRYRKYRTQHMFFTWGCDWDWLYALEDFQFMEDLIEYINKNNKHNITVIASTPGTYMEAIKQ
jgi:hypothetical protein